MFKHKVKPISPNDVLKLRTAPSDIIEFFNKELQRLGECSDHRDIIVPYSFYISIEDKGKVIDTFRSAGWSEVSFKNNTVLGGYVYFKM